MMKAVYPNLIKQIPHGQVMLLYFVRTDNDSRDCAGSSGSLIRPAKGAIAAAKELDSYGSRDLRDSHGHGHVVPGHGVTILWPSGRTREIHAD